MQHPPRTTSPLAHVASTSSSSSVAITSSWHIQRQSGNAVDVFGDDYDTSPFDETALANNGLSPLSVANQSPLRLETPVDWEDEEDPFADCYHPHSRLPRPASASAPASSAGPSGLVSRPTSSRPAPVVPKRGAAYGRYADSSSRARRHHQTTPSTMTSSANGLRKPQTPMQMLYDLPSTPASTPSASPNSRRRATLPSPPPVPARPRVVEPDAPLVVHGTRPSPFPLGPTPPRRTGRAAAMASKPVPVHIVDVAVERFGLQLQTPSTAPSSAASSSTDSSDDTELVTPTTTIASSSPVTSAITTTSGMMRRKPAVTALDMERERQWALWEAEHAPSAAIAVTEPVEKKKLFSISSSKSSSVEAKPTKDTTKKRSSRWWCCFGSSAHETDDEEEWHVEHEKSPRPASRLRKRAN